LFEKADFKIDEAELLKLSFEMEKYWNQIDRLNKIEHTFIESGLAMKVDGKSNFSEVVAGAHKAVNGIEDLLAMFHASDVKLSNDLADLLKKKGIDTKVFDDLLYSENPFSGRNWELHNLGTPNWLQRLRIDLVHIEVKYLEEYLKTNNNDRVALSRLEEVKELLKKYAQTAMHID